MPRKAKQAHQRLAIFIGLFLALHFATHFSGFAGISAHTQTLGWARMLYQFPLIEIALVLALATQVILGVGLLRMIWKRKRKGFWHWVQVVSAAYLAIFIINHTTAALVTRLGIGLDTNFYWAAGTVTLAPLKYAFAPYYVLAVSALCAHILAALHFRGPRKWHKPALIIGPVMGGAIVSAYGGLLYEITLPQAYLDFYSTFPGVSQRFIELNPNPVGF